MCGFCQRDTRRKDPRFRQVAAAIATDILRTSIAQHNLPCIQAICFVIEILWHQDLRVQTRRLQRNHPDLLRACIDFLAAPRSEEERIQLSMHASGDAGCICDLSIEAVRSLHPPCIQDSLSQQKYPPFMLLLRQTAQLVACTYNSAVLGLRGFKRARLAIKYGRRSPWPVELDDVAPRGLNTALNALEGLLGYCPEDQLLQIAGGMYFSHAFPAFPSILLCDILPRFFFHVVGHALKPWKGEQAAWEPLLNLLITGQFMIMPILSTHRDIITRVCTRPAAQPEVLNLVMFLTTCAALLLRVFELQHGAGHVGCKERSAYHVYRMCAVRIWLAIGAPMHAQDATISAWAAEDEADNLADGVSMLAPYIWQAHVCAHRACSRTPISERRAFGKCAGCAHAHYCSRACQRAAWKDVCAPHKEICGSLRELTSRIVPVFDGLAGSVDSHKFGKKCEEEGISDELLKAIADHFVIIYSR